MSDTAKSAAVATLVSVAYAFWAVPAVTAIAAYGTAIDAPRQALEAADSLLAADVESAGAAEGFGPSLADDALFLAPGLDVTRGRDAIRSMLAVRWSGPVTLKLHRVASGRSGDGGLGYTFGWIEQRSAGAVEYPKYLAAWRAEGGRWRVQAFALAAGSGRPSPAPPGDPVLAGYHGTASPGDPARLATEVAGAIDPLRRSQPPRRPAPRSRRSPTPTQWASAGRTSAGESNPCAPRTPRARVRIGGPGRRSRPPRPPAVISDTPSGKRRSRRVRPRTRST